MVQLPEGPVGLEAVPNIETLKITGLILVPLEEVLGRNNNICYLTTPTTDQSMR